MEERRKRRRRRRRRRYRHRNLVLLGMVLLAALVLVGGSEIFLRRAVKKRDDGTILQGVCVGNTDVSGMTEKEAVKAVKAEVKKYSTQKVSFKLETGDVIEAALEELGFTAKDITAAVKEAESYGKTGNAVLAYKTIRKSEKGKLAYTVPLKLKVSKEKVNTVLLSRSKEYLLVPVNASVTQENGEVTVVPEKKGEAPDSAEATKKLNQILNGDWDGKGTGLDVSIRETKPEITAEKLKGMTDLLGTHTTFYGADGSGRSQNIETGAAHLNGILIEPGEEVSANELMEPYTYENGYAEAGSYEGNKVVESMGGGICQVSTTLYNALLYAELEIVERYPHSMLVSYAEPSKDAAIAEDLLDLVFRNNLEHPVYLEAVLADGNITFNVYGKETRSAGRILEFISETTETKETTEKSFTATEDAIGYFEMQSASQPEIKAQLWKVVYENGAEVSRDVINYSTYVSAPEIYGVGTASTDPAATEKMKQAIQSQDEAAIQKAIQEILGKQ